MRLPEADDGGRQQIGATVGGSSRGSEAPPIFAIPPAEGNATGGSQFSSFPAAFLFAKPGITGSHGKSRLSAP